MGNKKNKAIVESIYRDLVRALATFLARKHYRERMEAAQKKAKKKKSPSRLKPRHRS